MVKDTYMVQKRLQAKAQAKAPTVHNTKPVTQNDIPKIERIPIKTEKEKYSNPLPTGVDQQLPQGLVIPPGTLIPSIGTQPSVRPPPKPPNVEDATTIPNLGQEPNVDFEKNSPHQEGIIYRNVCSPRSILPRAAIGADKTSEYFKVGTVVSSMTGRHRQNP